MQHETSSLFITVKVLSVKFVLSVKIAYAQFVSDVYVLFYISRDGVFLLSFSFMVVSLRNVIFVSKCCICCLYEFGIFPVDKEFLSN